MKALKNTVIKALFASLLSVFMLLGSFNLSNTINAETTHKSNSHIVHKIDIEFKPVNK